jgi:8-oxo-dGTP diphosphatase
MASEGKRHRPFSAVYLLLLNDEQVLLSKRKNTGHRDGEYSLVAGHIEKGESATEALVREAEEEAGIELNSQTLEPVHVIHRKSDNRVYLDIYFTTEEWKGELENREPEKCAELAWFDRSQLPENTAPYVEQAIENISDRAFSEYGW